MAVPGIKNYFRRACALTPVYKGHGRLYYNNLFMLLLLCFN